MKLNHLLCVSFLGLASACVELDPPATGEGVGDDVGPPEAVGRTVVQFADKPQIVTYEVFDGRALIEGDIDIGAAAPIVQVADGVEVGDLPAQAWTSLGATKWPSGTIRYQAPSLDHLGVTRFNRVYEAMAELINETQLDFQLVSSSSTSNRVYFTNATAGSSSSAVGMQGGLQAIRLTLDAPVSTIKHEILHAAGFWHEQSRTDRNSYVDINWFCITPGREHNFETHSGMSTTGYDDDSIMHYHSTAFLRTDISGCTWTIRRDDGTMIGRNTELSDADIASVNFWY